MNVLHKYTITNLLMNKKRTIVTIIGIILSCSLICGVTTLVSSFQGSMADFAKKEYGNYHISMENPTQEILNKTKLTFYQKNVGYSKLSGSQNIYKPYLFIEELDAKAFENLPLELVEGRLPQNEDEVVISQHIISNGHVDFKVGDILNLEVGQRYYEDAKLNQQNPFITEETFKKEFEKRYEIVGVVKRSNVEDYSAPGYTVFSCLEDTSKADVTYMLLKNPSDAFSIESDEKVSKNSDVLRFEGASQNNGVNVTLYMLSGIIIAIIMFASISVIRNSFTISVTERLRQFGMLSSVGATSKQIKKTVIFEGMILGLIAIPLGIIGGVAGIAVTLEVINNIIAEFAGGLLLNLHVSWQAILVAAGIALLTIFLSAIIPARKAAKISPIDAIRSSNDIKLTSKKLKTPHFLLKLFGIQGEIALKNLKRSKKKYRTTIFSIFVSITIFIAFSSFIEYGFKVSNAYYSETEYNFVVRDDRSEIYDKVTKLDNIKQFSIVKDFSIELPEKYISDDAEEISFCDVKLVCLNEECLKKYVKSVGVDLGENDAILIDKNVQYYEDKMREFEVTNLNKGDILELDNVSVRIAKRTEKLPFGVDNNYSGQATLVVQEKKFDEVCKAQDIPKMAGTLYIDSNNTEALTKDIEKIDKSAIENSYNLQESIRYQNAIVLVISIFLYGFIVLISLIGVTNIFNTVTTNMALRSKEFAILRSIGMTDKEFKKMINFESLFYGLKSLLYGIPVGILLSYLIYNAIGNMYTAKYTLPYMAILISIVFVFVIIFVTMTYSVNRCKKQNMIETIRKENI